MSIQFSLFRFHYETIFLAHFSLAAIDDEAEQTEWKLKKAREKSQFVFTEM